VATADDNAAYEQPILSSQIREYMTDPKSYWEERHKKRHHLYHGEPSHLALLSRKRGIGKGSRVLDLGCGQGRDGTFFSKRGLQVVGLDFSPSILKLAQLFYQDNKVKPLGLVQADIGAGLPVADTSFEIVHANLALHYFDDATLTRVLDDIYRVLKEGGLLGVSVRSINDPKYGVGEQIAKHGFNDQGCIRYFLDADYLEQKLHRFQIVHLSPFRPEFEADLLVAMAIRQG